MPRDDAIGLFWQDLPRKKGDRIARVMPPIPETGWTAPTEFPNLAAAKALTLDVETKDPELDKHGPGWARGVGHIVGIAAGTEDGGRWYFPMRHEVQQEDNLDPDHVITWAKDNFGREHQPKIGANITYDIGWLQQEGIIVRGRLHDVQFAEALLREAATVALEDLGQRYVGVGKDTDILFDWCQAYYGAPKTKWRRDIYRAPPRLVGPYGEGDVDLPFHVLEKQWPLLVQEGLMDVYDLECRLIPLMVAMRFAGVSVDLDHTERMRDRIVDELVGIDRQLKDMVGFEINTDASASMAKAFDALGISYGYTKPSKTYPEGQPSFTKSFLEKVQHPVAQLVLKKKAREKLKGTFLEGYILNAHVNGKVYGQFHQLRSDSGGARSGRLSSSDPNLQNIPIRSKLGKEIRKGFIPDLGHEKWRKNDYSQIEYRALAHFAVGEGADDVRAQYNADPDVDFHAMVQATILRVVNQEIERPIVKNVNFGATYGMGEAKLAQQLKLSPDEAKELFAAIHKSAPFLRATMDATMAEADRLGYITTIRGRRSRFDLWEPDVWYKSGEVRPKPVPYERAIRKWPKIRRSHLHKALNRRLQGSAADLIKKAMLDCYEQGIFNETGVPRLTVHDELDFSDPGGKDEAFREMLHVMENTIPFNVPIRVGNEIGPSWGEVEEVEA